MDPSAGKTLRFEASLPQLPVPPVSSTAAKYLETVQPGDFDGYYNKLVAAGVQLEFIKYADALFELLLPPLSSRIPR